MRFRIKKENFLPHQLQWWDLDTFYKIMVGGYGSGKTYIGALRSLYLSYSNSPHPGMYVSPTWALATKTIILTLKELMTRAELDYKFNQQRGEFIIDNWNGRIWIGSGDKPDSLRGPNLAWAGIDEPFIQRKEVFDQMVASVRIASAECREIYLTGTPEQMNWGWKLTNRTDLDMGIVYGSTLNNSYLPQQYKDNLLSAYSPEQIDAYVYGKFVNLTQGRVYREFERDKHVMEREVQDLSIGIGMDFNVDAMSSIVFYKGTNWIHVFDEIRLKNSNTFEMCNVLKDKYPDAIIYPDATGSARRSSATQSDHDIIKKAGFKIRSPRKNPPVRDRVNAVNKLLRDENFSCYNCPNLIMDLERNVWKSGDIDKTDPEQSHASDAIGYAIEYLFPIRSRLAVSKGW